MALFQTFALLMMNTLQIVVSDLLFTLYVSGIPYTAALTKVDTTCPATNDDITVVFESKAVANVVQTLSESLNLDKRYILPVEVNNFVKTVGQVLMIIDQDTISVYFVFVTFILYYRPRFYLGLFKRILRNLLSFF